MPTCPEPSRSLVLTGDPDLLEELLRLAATVGVELDVAVDAGSARRSWATAPDVVVGADVLAAVVRARLPRRCDVAVVGTDLDDAGIWPLAVDVGAERVVFLPEAEPWLVERWSDASESGGHHGAIVAVLGGRGGAGATTLACALAVTAHRSGRLAMLVDGDPLGGGIDLVFGGEGQPGLRWPELSGTRGRVPAQALSAALPRMDGLSVLSFDRAAAGPVPTDAVTAVLASGRRAHELVVVDLPRSLDEASRLVLALATTTVLVVPREVRAAAAAARIATQVTLLCADVRVVTRGPSPAGLSGQQIAASLGVPLVGDLRTEPGLALALERGEPPARRARGPLSALCGVLLDDLLPASDRAA